MSGNILTKIFGSKHDRDVKKIHPMVDHINELYEKLESLSDDELKGKTEEFKKSIKERTAELDGQLDALKEEFAGIKTHGLSEEERAEVRSQRENLLQQMKDIQKQIKEVEKEVLDDILPEAFAVVKETCRRLVWCCTMVKSPRWPPEREKPWWPPYPFT
jgi:preprotein translocase subunit SecA